MNNPMRPNIENEIIQLHRFFQDWFNGEIPRSTGSFCRLTEVLAPGFIIISPDAGILNRATLLNSLDSAHNTRQGMRIWIQDILLPHQIGENYIATYQEWQELEGRVTARLSTAVFHVHPGTPNGVRWIHVHETWLAQN